MLVTFQETKKVGLDFASRGLGSIVVAHLELGDFTAYSDERRLVDKHQTLAAQGASPS
jgi:hypothetical protein